MDEYYLLQNEIIYASSISALTQDYSGQVLSYGIQQEGLSTNLIEEKIVPISVIFGKSSLESIVMYLKDFLGLGFNDIARLVNRDQRTIWVTYTNAKKKNLVLDLDNISQLTLPLSIFRSRNLSVLENIVLYLRTTHSLSFNQISDLIGKNYQTIRTVYNRALVKMDREK